MTERIFVAGHKGMVGSALIRQLDSHANVCLITRSREQLDLTKQRVVSEFFSSNGIDQVYLAAAKVGGIHANNEYPADFIYENLMMQCNVIHAAYEAGIKKLLFLGSSCIYPRNIEQPMSEAALLSDKLELTNEPYAIAKIAGIKLCESYNRQYGVDYRCVMPTNLYGENDNFHPDNSHVIPAMMRRIHNAKLNGDKQVVIWGTGKPMREFLHVDDLASACSFVMQIPKKEFVKRVDSRCSHINVGTGVDCSIRQLAESLCRVIGYKGELCFDVSKPDGTPRKLLDVSQLTQLGWTASIELERGLERTYEWFQNHVTELRGAI